MFAKYLGVIFLATLVAAEVPSYFPICGRRNPNLDQCIIDATNALRDKLKTGIPELDLPPLDPLNLEGFTLADTPALKAHARNITIHGLGDVDVKSFHVDFEKHEYHGVNLYKTLILDAEYDVNAKILVPISGSGPIHIEASDTTVEYTMKWKLVKKNGAEYIFITSITTKINLGNFTSDFKTTGDPDGTLTTAINAALNGARKEILETIMPNLEKICSEQAINLANQIGSHMTFDELYPDRE